jgi:hypothetical protein
VIGTKIKLLVAGGIAAASLVAGSTSASAAITSFSVNEQATIQQDGSVVVVTGFIQCTNGDSAVVDVSVLQAKGQIITDGFGDTTVACTGSLQAWSIPVPATIGSFKNGWASSVTSAFDTTDGTFTQVNQNLHLGK